MASGAGLATFITGTGTKSINCGLIPTWMRIHFKNSNILPSEGYIYGTGQWVYPDNSSSMTSGKAIQVKDNSGTIILEGTWTGFSGTNANFNITTAPATMPQAFFEFGN